MEYAFIKCFSGENWKKRTWEAVTWERDVFEELFPGKERVITVLNEAPPLLKQEVLSGGKLLYSIDEDQKTKFYINTIREYEDTKHLRKIQYKYLKNRIKQSNF